MPQPPCPSSNLEELSPPPQNETLTNGRDDCDGKVEGTGEFPLDTSPVWLGLHDHQLQLPVVLAGDVVLSFEPDLLGFEFLLLPHLVVGLQGIKDGSPDQQVSERADDEGQGPHVLPLHGRQQGASEGTMSPPGRPGIRQAAAAAAGGQLPGGLAAAPGQLVLRRRPLPARLLGLLGRGEAQEAAGAPGPGALKPGNSAQDLPKPSCPSAQGHPGHPRSSPAPRPGAGGPRRALAEGRERWAAVPARSPVAGGWVPPRTWSGEGSPAARAGPSPSQVFFRRRCGAAGGKRAAAARPSAWNRAGDEEKRPPSGTARGARPAPARGSAGRAGRDGLSSLFLPPRCEAESGKPACCRWPRREQRSDVRCGEGGGGGGGVRRRAGS